MIQYTALQRQTSEKTHIMIFKSKPIAKTKKADEALFFGRILLSVNTFFRGKYVPGISS